MKQKVFDILELGLKDDGKSFYTNEEKVIMLLKLIETAYDDAIEAVNEGCGHDTGAEYINSF